jgi:hypothetical protein
MQISCESCAERQDHAFRCVAHKSFVPSRELAAQQILAAMSEYCRHAHAGGELLQRYKVLASPRQNRALELA